MKSLVFNTKSWHYWVIDKFGDYDYSLKESDICTYTRLFILALLRLWFIVIVVTMGGGFAIGVLLCPLVYLVECLIHMHPGKDLVNFMMVGMAAYGVIFLICLVAALKAYLKSLRRKNYVDSIPPGIIKIMYKNWKEKTCVKIKFE